MMTTGPELGSIRHFWLSGRLIGIEAAAEYAEILERPGCYTTARVEAGRARWHAAHARRLAEDSRALGLPEPGEDDIAEAFASLGGAEFGEGAGVVRLKACASSEGTLALVAHARGLGIEPPAWKAGLAPFPHPGPGDHPGAKLSHRPALARARALCGTAGSDEVLLLDSDGRLVEGARSSLIVVDAQGALATPAACLGGVASIALAVARARSPAPITPETLLDRQSLAGARELIALNAVRGAIPVTEFAGQPVGDGQPGAACRSLQACLQAR